MPTRPVVAEHSSLVRWSAAPSVSVAVRDCETVLLDVRAGAYYVLNETGGAIWAALRRGGGVGAPIGGSRSGAGGGTGEEGREGAVREAARPPFDALTEARGCGHGKQVIAARRTACGGTSQS